MTFSDIFWQISDIFRHDTDNFRWNIDNFRRDIDNFQCDIDNFRRYTDNFWRNTEILQPRRWLWHFTTFFNNLQNFTTFNDIFRQNFPIFSDISWHFPTFSDQIYVVKCRCQLLGGASEGFWKNFDPFNFRPRKKKLDFFGPFNFRSHGAELGEGGRN